MTPQTSGPTSIALGPLDGCGLTDDLLWRTTFTAMASPVQVQLGYDTERPSYCHAQVRALFAEVERECTRFDPFSDLMRANAAANDWQVVGRRCYEAVQAAALAHERTGGLFDPRTLRTLTGLGYGRSRSVGAPGLAPGEAMPAARPARAPWTPGFDAGRRAIRVGPEPIDLGGIGKGLALRWSAELLDAAGCTSFLIDAGGDCVARGAAPDDAEWRIGVEDPRGGRTPVAVLEGDDIACATSSLRLLSWRAGGQRVHHLIDPRTGRPGGGGLGAVTVVADDPAEAEVWSKVLFLRGADDIAAVAEAHGLRALWVAGPDVATSVPVTVSMTDAMRAHVCWERS